MMRFVTLLILLGFGLIISCDDAELPEPPPPTLCDTLVSDTLTYNAHLQLIIDETCAFSGCHDAIESAPGNFTNYSTLEPYLSDGTFRERIFEERDMPLAPGQFQPGQMDSVECWLNTGFLEN